MAAVNEVCANHSGMQVEITTIKDELKDEIKPTIKAIADEVMGMRVYNAKLAGGGLVVIALLKHFGIY